MFDQIIVFLTLLLALFLFAQGRLRYDLVALLALLSVTLTGVIDSQDAFLGFGQPQVITVASILVITRGLSNSGIDEVITRLLESVSSRSTSVQVLSLTTAVAVLSAFMNNVGALALLMPVTFRMSDRAGIPVSKLLMPLAFGSLLGGMTTAIGTPPNLIISGFRQEVKGMPFEIFEFTPVGLGVAVACILFIGIVGWRLIPLRKAAGSGEDLFSIEEGYVTELRVPPSSVLANKTILSLEHLVDVDATIVATIHDQHRRYNPSGTTIIRPNDVLIVQATAKDLTEMTAKMGLEMVGSKGLSMRDIRSDEVILSEAVVKNTSPLVYRTVRDINLRGRFGINLLAVARQGARVEERLREISFRPGDILLFQGPTERLSQTIQSLGCLPLPQRDIDFIKGEKRPFLALGIFSVAIFLTALGYLPVHLSFPAAAVAMVLTSLLSLRQAYQNIDWTILILLGAMIPVGQALEVSGGAQTIANFILQFSGTSHPLVSLGLLMVVTMTLSDIINNAAAAVLLAPIGINIASALGVSPDPFLIAIALAASCAFMTPIGHQSNTLILGPGGYRFTDYWRMGLPVQIIVLATAIPLIWIVWPF